MSVHSEKRKQDQVIAALLASRTIADAATVAGVSENTLLRWLREDEFAAAYREARRDVLAQATGQLAAACGQAVAALVDVLGDGDAPASARVSAAKAVLEHAAKAVELDDLAARVERLEKGGTL